MLEVIKLKRSTYYYHAKRALQIDKYARARECIRAIYQDHKGRYGYRRMTAALKAQGLILNHKTVLKLMKSENVLCKVRIKKYRSFLGEVGQIAPNLLQRDFTTAAPNQKWATDITEFRMFGERCYLSVLMDLHTQDVIHFTMANNPKLPLVTRMIDEALKREPEAGKGLIIHSDQGWHYQHRAYRDILSAREISQSMSRRGNCLDNAMMEGFFGILKSELLYLQEFNSMDHFKEELISYMDYYNNRRIKLKLIKTTG